MQYDQRLALREAASLKLAPDKVFVGQFVIDQSDKPPFEGYLSHDLSDWWLHFCPSLDLCVVKDGSGQPFGAILGIALNDAGQHLAGEVVVTLHQGETLMDAMERLIASLTGRYIAVTRGKAAPFVYTDAVGEMAVVYDTRTGVTGSTLPLTLTRDIIDRGDIDHRAVMESPGHYALGYTRDAHCERLLPNHRLDLAQITQARFWPRDDVPWLAASELAFDDMIDELLAILRRNTVGFLQTKPSVFPLSGGQDSRILITAARDHVHLAKAIFGMHHNWASGRDCDVGAEVAARMGLDYRRISAPGPRKWGRRAFHTRVGYAVNSGGMNSVTHTALLPEGHLVIRGNVMGLTRANDWGRGLRPRPWDDASFGIARLLMGEAVDPAQRPDDLERRYLDWRASLPGTVKYRSHDLSFCENYLPNSLGARNYAYTNVTHVNPFASRRVIALVSAVDPQLRKNNRINNRLLEISAPDLADIRLV
ncbi:hypothetical protein [Yoonia sp.]|uniref:hypothetical protein n=1 Tax=Yoonia sp. TaxID=2212373 RepID=UPI00391B258F